MRRIVITSCISAGLLGIGFTAMSAPKPDSKSKKVTYSEVAPLLNSKCVDCHRPGQVAPFSLIGYNNAKKWSKMITQVTSERLMPPWKSVDPVGTFHDDKRLSATEIQMLKDWAAAGAPKGVVEPKPPTFASEWALGKPDKVVYAEKSFQLGPEGDDVYRNFVVRMDSDKDTWINGFDVRPGNPKVVHHVIVYIDPKKNARKLEEKTNDGQPGYIAYGGPGFFPVAGLGGWAPGLRPRLAAKGLGILIPKGSDLVIQVHYHKNGKVEQDQTKVALYEAKEPIQKEIASLWMFKFNLNIPAGEQAHTEVKTQVLRDDMTIRGFMPHMHLLGKRMSAVATLPDGTTKQLIKVEDWDFNWQMSYVLKEPMRLPKGTKISISATYDNSSKNPRNPNNPPRQVTWGEQTTDEMFLMIAYGTYDHIDGPIGSRGFIG